MNLRSIIRLTMAAIGSLALAASASGEVRLPVSDVSKVRAPQSVFIEKDYFKYADRRLYNIEEPSLWKLSRDPNSRAFRFIYLPFEGAGLSIRIDFATPDDAKLIWKIFEGRPNDGWGKVVKQDEIELTKEQIKLFEFELKRLDFWYFERSFEDGERLGTVWLLEGAEYGKYHAVPRANQNMGIIYEFERFLVRFAQLEESLLGIEEGE